MLCKLGMGPKTSGGGATAVSLTPAQVSQVTPLAGLDEAPCPLNQRPPPAVSAPQASHRVGLTGKSPGLVDTGLDASFGVLPSGQG